MKQLRILTGQHAGVRIDLTSARYLVSADEQADLQITDWICDPLTLQTDPNDMISIDAPTADHTTVQAAAAACFADFVPRRFGDIVLCTGPTDQAWPSDMELIARLMRPLQAPVAAVRRWQPALAACVAAGLLLATAGLGTALARLGRDPNASVLAEPLKVTVERTLTQLALPGLVVTQQGEEVGVHGLVAGPAEVATLRNALQSVSAGRIVHAYASASDIAQSIAEGLAQPGLQVSHQGHGVFVVSGTAPDIERLREAAVRIAGDLAPLVQRIEITASARTNFDRTPLRAMLSGNGMQYVQTPDGAKHLSIDREAPTSPDAPAQPL